MNSACCWKCAKTNATVNYNKFVVTEARSFSGRWRTRFYLCRDCYDLLKKWVREK